MKALKKERVMQMLIGLIVFIAFAIIGCDNSTKVQTTGVSASFFSESKFNKIQNNTLALNEV